GAVEKLCYGHADLRCGVADAGQGVQPVSTEGNGFGDGGEGGAGDQGHGFGVAVHDEQELVAAHPRGEHHRCRQVSEPACDLGEHVVPAVVAVGVVDCFAAVQVEQEHSDRARGVHEVVQVCEGSTSVR